MSVPSEHAIDRFRAQILQGYFLEGDDGQPWPEKEWCRPCAQAVAFHYRRRHGMRGLSWWECWAGDDSPRRCCGCDAPLDNGGLTVYAIDDEIDNCETHGPEGAAIELIMVLDALPSDDSRRPQVLAWLEKAVASAGPVPTSRSLRELLP